MPFPNRRTFLHSVAGSALVVPGMRMVRAEEPKREIPVSGLDQPDLRPLDDLMTGFVRKHEVPGAAMAVAKEGRLVYARGFGEADRMTKRAVQPGDLFRIASVSKPLTSAAIMQLIEQKKLSLDDCVVDRMKLDAFIPAGKKMDERWSKITVRQCLNHTGGWDRDKSFDPIGRAKQIADDLGKKTPTAPHDVVRWMMGRPLDFDPGTRTAYSNLGYLILGRIIAQVTGRGYEEVVRTDVLGRLGVKQPRLGRALESDRFQNEVRYYDRKNRTGPSLYEPNRGKAVPLPDGAENFEGFEAHGAWVAGAPDLVRFASALDADSPIRLLKPETLQAMWERPNGRTGGDDEKKPADVWWGLGWQIRELGEKSRRNQWHGGYIAGTEAILVRRVDRFCWAVLFNTNNTPTDKRLSQTIDPLVHEAVDAVKKWPTGDQFPQYLDRKN